VCSSITILLSSVLLVSGQQINAASLGFDAYLPQEDAGTYFDLMTAESKTEVRKRLFQLDARAVKECDIILCLFDGRVPDEGTCIVRNGVS
jgi:nucleoside 2-deoxyribosyltransferase